MLLHRGSTVDSPGTHPSGLTPSCTEVTAAAAAGSLAGMERATTRAEPPIDVLIVGAGISGISMAAHLQMLCPGTSFTMLDRRDELGGTWDLFRYPGVRSDSDMHSLGFRFEPWVHDKAIADGEAIREYLHRVVDERGIRPHIRFGSRVCCNVSERNGLPRSSGQPTS